MSPDTLAPAANPTFAELGVPGFICRALAARGIEEPFAIQAATIADALAGRDVCGRAPTGSGKTLAFGIPLIACTEPAEPRAPRSLVLAPTRELAEQIAGELRSFAGRVRVGVVYGGVPYGAQVKALRQGVDVLVACPGRLEDLIEQGAVRLHDVDHVVLDEADRMADMGFIPAVRRILAQCHDDRQTVLFSATLDGDVAAFIREHLEDPVRHEVGEDTPDITSAHHEVWSVDRAERVAVTAELLGAAWPAVVFTRTRHGADRLAKQLVRAGVPAAPIHGGRTQGQRTRALSEFADGRVHALVATDVAARGIHVDGVAAVVHFDPPEDHKTYVHRSGRTARAGAGGVVVSLVLPDQVRDVQSMLRKVGLDLAVTAPDAAAIRDRLMDAVPGAGQVTPQATAPAPTTSGSTKSAGPQTEGRDGRRRNRKRNRGGRQGSPQGGTQHRSDERAPSAREDRRSAGSGARGGDSAERAGRTGTSRSDDRSRDAGTRDGGARDGGARDGGARRGGRPNAKARRARRRHGDGGR